MKHSAELRKLLRAALFTATTCAATLVIQIPMPVTNGYVNIGDCFVLLGAWVLGPLYGAFAGGVGSALADLLSGYAYYVPATLLIKAAMAVLAAMLSAALHRHCKLHLSRLLGGIVAELWMVGGYFGYACLLLGEGLTATMSIPGNLFQGAVGIVGAMALAAALHGAKAMTGGIQNG